MPDRQPSKSLAVVGTHILDGKVFADVDGLSNLLQSLRQHHAGTAVETFIDGLQNTLLTMKLTTLSIQNPAIDPGPNVSALSLDD